jgi:hypothetical protein
MDLSLAQFVLPSAIAGAFGIGTAILAAKFSASNDRKRLEREMKQRQEAWQREFATKYAEVAATNAKQAENLRQQFAGAYLYIKNSVSDENDPFSGAAQEMHGSDRRFLANGVRLTIGASQQSDLVIPDPNRSMSRQHATIEVIAGEVWITDLNSTNGTFVNGIKISGRTRVGDGSTLRFGQAEALLKLL